MKTITFVTGNQAKVDATRKYIHVPIEHKNIDLTEIQTLDAKELVTHKVKEAYALIKQPVLVEDTSVTFHALGNLPGTYIKWFLQELGNEKLCSIVPQDNRSATAKVTFGFYDGEQVFLFEGSTKGTIPTSPKGKKGFGWDDIFIPEGSTKTYAEMSDEEFDTASIRKIALEKMKKELAYEKK